MDSVVLRNVSQMMVSARLLPDGIAVSFADGYSGTIPFDALEDVQDPASITGLELPNPYELYLVADDGEHPEIPWDFARHYCDSSYRERMEAQALLGRRTLGNRIRQLRKSAGLTQEALARTADIGRVTLIRLEKGEQTAKFKTLAAIAQAVGRPTIDLFLEPESFDQSESVIDRKAVDPAPDQLTNIELAAWSENQTRHAAELKGLDEASNEALLGIKQVIDGFDSLRLDPANEPQVALIEEGLNVAARIFKAIRAAKVLCEMGYYEQALVLARSCLEHLAIAFDLPLSETTRAVLKSGGEFQYKEIVDRIDRHYGELRFGERWKTNYPILSKAVHASGTRLQQQPLDNGEVGYYVAFTNFYNEQLALKTIEVIWGEIKLLVYLVQGMATGVRMEWDANKAYGALYRSIPKEKIAS